jgi:hypothetical protein
MRVLIVAGTSGRSACFLPDVFRFFSRGSNMEDRMESDPYHRSEHFADEYALELLHLAMVQGEQEAWDWMYLKSGMQVLVSSTILCLPPN